MIKRNILHEKVCKCMNLEEGEKREREKSKQEKEKLVIGRNHTQVKWINLLIILSRNVYAMWQGSGPCFKFGLK